MKTENILEIEDIDENARVLRGGSWGSFARDCRAAYRGGNAPGFRYSNVGFRVAFRLD